ncbi:uncharacterized protein LOC142771753 isoform X2 [Rhipicephalus microplus]|uniref:uncharacterized protein LOC142771753 isoform X2 n=1 Tax=Rhipicephalus microplus TaxID=6941 RepID=UPI003F6BC8CB
MAYRIHPFFSIVRQFPVSSARATLRYTTPTSTGIPRSSLEIHMCSLQGPSSLVHVVLLCHSTPTPLPLRDPVVLLQPSQCHSAFGGGSSRSRRCVSATANKRSLRCLQFNLDPLCKPPGFRSVGVELCLHH